MTEMTSPSQHDSIPFVGRQAIYARLQQQILDSPHRHAIVFTGHAGMGKTALLQQFLRVFSEPILAVFTSLSENSFPDDSKLLQELIDGINTLLNEHNFSMSRVPQLEADTDADLLAWFRETYLPEVLHVIRPHRRIVWLLDDGEKLLDHAGFAAYLHTLLEANPQFSIILTTHTDNEEKLAGLKPLVNPVIVERIHRLNADESADLIRQYAPGVADTITNSIFVASGGHPRLLARYGNKLQEHRAEHGDTDAFEKAKSDVYKESQADFRQIWLRLSRDERLVLTAIASLLYDDPLEHVSAKGIEAWLVETDYLLDIVTISAALRGLDYQDIVSQRQNDGIKLTMGLMQQWLLEQARLDNGNAIQRGQLPLRLLMIVFVVIVLILLLMFFVIPPQYLDSGTGVATATLAS